MLVQDAQGLSKTASARHLEEIKAIGEEIKQAAVQAKEKDALLKQLQVRGNEKDELVPKIVTNLWAMAPCFHLGSCVIFWLLACFFNYLSCSLGYFFLFF